MSQERPLLVPAGRGNALNLLFKAAVQLALVMEGDPGHDFGVMRQSGHRLLYRSDEVKPVKE
jgi:hypothetical protein